MSDKQTEENDNNQGQGLTYAQMVHIREAGEAWVKAENDLSQAIHSQDEGAEATPDFQAPIAAQQAFYAALRECWTR